MVRSNAVRRGKSAGRRRARGRLFSADLFYSPDGEMFDIDGKIRRLGVEMEAAGIYGVARLSLTRKR